MPKYDFKCCVCGKIEERHVAYSEADKQVSKCCGVKAKRLSHYNTLQINIPEAFAEANRNGYTQMDLERDMAGPDTVPVHNKWV